MLFLYQCRDIMPVPNNICDLSFLFWIIVDESNRSIVILGFF